MYTPEYITAAERLLDSAEQNAKDPDVKARLHLVRIEFDYLRKMAKIFHYVEIGISPPNADGKVHRCRCRGTPSGIAPNMRSCHHCERADGEPEPARTYVLMPVSNRPL